MLDILPKRPYTLLVTDIPYGFCITRSTYNDMPYKYPQIEKIVKYFVGIVMEDHNISLHGSVIIDNKCFEVTMSCYKTYALVSCKLFFYNILFMIFFS